MQVDPGVDAFAVGDGRRDRAAVGHQASSRQAAGTSSHQPWVARSARDRTAAAPKTARTGREVERVALVVDERADRVPQQRVQARPGHDGVQPP